MSAHRSRECRAKKKNLNSRKGHWADIDKELLMALFLLAMIKVHVSLEAALCDGNQSLNSERFLEPMEAFRTLVKLQKVDINL